jgi:hypothetical protein
MDGFFPTAPRNGISLTGMSRKSDSDLRGWVPPPSPLVGVEEAFVRTRDLVATSLGLKY